MVRAPGESGETHDYSTPMPEQRLPGDELTGREVVRDDWNESPAVVAQAPAKDLPCECLLVDRFVGLDYLGGWRMISKFLE